MEIDTATRVGVGGVGVGLVVAVLSFVFPHLSWLVWVPFLLLGAVMALWGFVPVFRHVFPWFSTEPAIGQFDLRTPPLAPAPAPAPLVAASPSMLELFQTDFQGPGKIFEETNIQFGPDGPKSTFHTNLYQDFQAGSKFLAFYVPRSPMAHRTYAALASQAVPIMERIEAGIQVSGGMMGENIMTASADLAFTGFVYLYCDDGPQVHELSDLTKLYEQNGLKLRVRANDYHAMKMMNWAHTVETFRPPPPLSETKAKLVFRGVTSTTVAASNIRERRIFEIEIFNDSAVNLDNCCVYVTAIKANDRSVPYVDHLPKALLTRENQARAGGGPFNLRARQPKPIRLCSRIDGKMNEILFTYEGKEESFWGFSLRDSTDLTVTLVAYGAPDASTVSLHLWVDEANRLHVEKDEPKEAGLGLI